MAYDSNMSKNAGISFCTVSQPVRNVNVVCKGTQDISYYIDFYFRWHGGWHIAVTAAWVNAGISLSNCPRING